MAQLRIEPQDSPLVLSASANACRPVPPGPDGSDADGRGSRSDLVARMRAGDESALDNLLALHWDELVRYADDLASGADAAEDLVQRAFIRLWERRARWRADSAPRALLFRIVRNLALNEQRRARVRRLWSRSELRSPRAQPSPLDQAVASDLKTAARDAVARLPPRRREVFRLARNHGLSYQEIADCLEISPQTVANQMSAALASLRRSLSPFLE